MISIRICDSTKTIDEVTESWVFQQIVNRRNTGAPVWVKVIIEDDLRNMILSTRNSPHSRTTYRPPRGPEKVLLDLWDAMGLNDAGFHPNQLIKFLHKVRGI